MVMPRCSKSVTGPGRRARHTLGRLAVCLVIAAVLLMVLAASAQAYVPGKQAWVKTYGTAAHEASAWDVATGPGGVVCTAGWRDSGAGGWDMLVIKYNSAGKKLWSKTFNGPGNGDDVATDLLFDRKGNIYVLGDVTNVAGNTDIVVIKYSPAGKRLWRKAYNGPQNLDEEPADLILDTAGNVYVSGSSAVGPAPGGGTFYGLVTLKYDAAGHLKWAYRMDPLLSDPDAGSIRASVIRLDGARNVYVAGQSVYMKVSTALTLKLSGKDGHKIKANVYTEGPEGLDASSSASSMDVRGKSVVITGWVAPFDLSAPPDVLVAKYDLSLNQKWAYKYDGTAHKYDAGDDVALDGAGNVLVTGTSTVPVTGGTTEKCTTFKLNGLGHLKWMRFLLPRGHDSSSGYYIVLDATGAAYVGAAAEGLTNGTNFLTVKYSAGGARKWYRVWNGAGNYDDDPGYIALGSKNTVYVAGEGTARGHFSQSVVVKYLR